MSANSDGLFIYPLPVTCVNKALSNIALSTGLQENYRFLACAISLMSTFLLTFLNVKSCERS